MEPITSFLQFVLTLLFPKLWFLFFLMRFIITPLTFPINIIIGILTALFGLIIADYIKLRSIDSNDDTFSNESLSTHENIKITLGIPCIPPDIKNLEKLIINSNEQSRIPDEIIISLSESSDIQGKQLEKKLNKISQSPIKIITTPHKAYAGINRNTIAKHSNCDYISYIDSDDIMHPERLKLIEQTLIKYNKPIGLLHGFGYGYNTNVKISDFETWDSNKFFKYHDTHRKHKGMSDLVPNPLSGISVQHGHPTYAKKLFKEVKFTSRPRAQDVEMVRKVFDHYGDSDKNLVYIKAPLTFYIKRNIETLK